MRRQDLKELEHDRCDAPEMTGPYLPLPSLSDSGRFDECRMVLGIHLLVGGCEDHIAPVRREQFQVVLERPGVFLKIFVRAELGRIDENGCDRHVALLLGPVDQGQMSFVQCPHGWNESDAFALHAHLVDKTVGLLGG